jgi:hypothetical protein
MYYRVAIQADTSTRWRWCSTVLSSLDTVFRFLRLNYAPLEHLLVFSSGSCEEIDEQLACENQGLGSSSVTAAHFLQERLLRSPEMTQGTPERDEGADRRWQPSLMGANAARSHPSVQENGTEGSGLVGTGMSALERRRLELEHGPGGDHAVAYRFALPASMPQVLAWMRLLVRVQDGTLPS